MPFDFSRAWLLMLALVTGMMASSCGSGGSSDPGGKGIEASWTYMVYMAADNSLSPYAKMDINEMESVGSSNQVSVVVEAEFNTGTTPGVPEGTVRGLVASDSDNEHMGSWYRSIGDKDMTDPAALSDFISWAAQNYPADHYALVLWSHGMGWKEGGASYKGMISDGAASLMTLGEMSQAIRESGVFFEVINMDACLMGMYEVAYEFKGQASYLVFSEEEYPANGDPYGVILGHLTDDPSMDGRQLALTITQDSLAFYADPGVNVTVTKSAVDMALAEGLHDELDALAGYMVDHMYPLRDGIEWARDAAFAYDYPTYIDLGDFLKKLRDCTDDPILHELIEAVIGSDSGQGTLQQMVIANGVYLDPGDDSNEGITASMGLAIYLPSSDLANLQSGTIDLARYADLACNESTYGVTTWSDFLDIFLDT